MSNPIDRDTLMSMARFAGQVERYHTWPVLRRQSNAEHTWQVMRIYCELFGPPPVSVWMHLLHHDSPELGTGDLPFPVKKDNPELGPILGKIEDAQMLRMGIRPPSVPLPEHERKLCKIADLLEMAEFGWTEIQMGNTLARPILEDTLNAAYSMARDVSQGTSELVDAWIVSGGARRGPNLTDAL